MNLFESGKKTEVQVETSSLADLSAADAAHIARLSQRIIAEATTLDGLSEKHRNHLITIAALMGMAAGRTLGDAEFEARNERVATEHWPHAEWVDPLPAGTMPPETWDQIFGALTDDTAR